MRGSGQQNFTIIWIVVIGVIIGFIVLVVAAFRKANQERERLKAIQEQNNRMMREMEEDDRRRRERIRVAQEAEKKEKEHKREMTFAAFSGLIGSSRWGDDLFRDPDQAKRIDRLDYDAAKMAVCAYDSRYHAGLIKGTSGRYYIVSGEQCNCPDFLRQKRPCKHMYFLGQYVTDHGYAFSETDYEIGLKGSQAILVGRFPGGKEAAISNLKERGCIPIENMNSEVNLAIIGKTTAQKMLENLAAKEIRMLDYKDALQIFTSEIRHPEIVDAKEEKSV